MTDPLPICSEREDLFRLLVEKVKDYAIFALDPSGIVASWNAGAERIKGYRAAEIVGHHFSRFYPEEAIRSGWPQIELELATRHGSFEDEGWRVRKDGSRFWANVVITALHDEHGRLCGFAKVTRDLTERQRMERIEADARQMGQFVAMLAHELRNPLAPILSAASLGLRTLGQPDKVEWALGVVQRQAEHLTKLVDDLLDVSRITRGKIRLERRRVPLSEVVQRAVEAVREGCEAKQHSLVLPERIDAVVRGDVVRLTQVLTNLLNNACKYTRNGGRIEVAAQVEGERVRLAVRDNGAGLSPSLLPQVFDLFTQERRTLARSEGGLGLGLAIARRLVEMHRGTLTAHSAGPGCGSEFVIDLPLFRGGEIGTDADRLSVLVVDDNRDAAQTLQGMMELEGHHCATAFDGEAALEAAQRVLPDVILLDVGLPGLNGYEVARRIRNMPELEGVILAAVTGYASDEDRREAFEAGFDAHLAKPVTHEELLRALPILTPDP